MKRILFFIIALTATVGMLQAAQFSTTERAEINAMIHDYLLQNPEILVQMSDKLQQQQFEQIQKQALSAIKANSQALFSPQGTQVAGNPKGSVTLVEFFDYQCVHCANLHKEHIVEDLIRKNPELRVVYREFPIFGAASNYAAKAAMAASLQGKYLEMRDAIFNLNEIEGSLKTADIDKAAEKTGLNMAQYRMSLKRDNQMFQNYVDVDYKLAKALGIQGTPAFIIAPTPQTGSANGKTAFIPGLVGTEQLQQFINAAK